jgi:hypothetical protein
MRAETLLFRLSRDTTSADTALDGASFDGQLVAGIGLALLALTVLGAIALIVAALVQISHAVHLPEPERTRWVLSVVFAPVFGAIAWFAVGNHPQLRRPV